jgi:hypothetical protein
MMASDPAPATAPRPPKPGKRYFTVADANRALPYVARIVDDITKAYRQVVALRQRIERPQPGDDTDALNHDYEGAIEHINGLIDELQDVGVELKDFQMGLVDFPAVHDGREVYLCWRQGEKQVEAWHELDTGFAGRQPASTLRPAGKRD